MSGPLGSQAADAVGTINLRGGTLQYSTLNQFDYSGRFSANPNQLYTVDTTNQTVTWSHALVSPGGILTKLGLGRLVLANTNNTYSGGTVVNQGTLQAMVDHALGTGDVSVTNGATLELTTPHTLDEQAALYLVGTNPGVNLNYTGTQIVIVSTVSFDGGNTFAAPGLWGAPGSGAAFTDSHLQGPGLLQVTGDGALSKPIYATWCMVWINSNDANQFLYNEGATAFMGSFDSIDWADNSYVNASLNTMKRAGINAVICDLSNGWGWLNGIVQNIQSLALGKRMKVFVAVGNIPDVTTFESRCGDAWNLFAGSSAPYAPTYLAKDGKPVLVCYTVPSQYQQFVASTGANRQHFTLVRGAGESGPNATDAWGWQLNPAVGPAASTNAVFVNPSVKWTNSADFWRKSQAWLDYSFKTAKDSRPNFIIVGSFDDLPERNSWLPAETSGTPVSGMQMRDIYGAISPTNYYARVGQWIQGTPTAVSGGYIPDGCYTVMSRSSQTYWNMPNSVGTNLGAAGRPLQLSATATDLDHYFMFYHLGSNQFRIYSLNSGLPLSGTNSAADGRLAFQDWDGPNSAQRWQLVFTNGYFLVQSPMTGKVMATGSTSAGASVVLNVPTNSTASQTWLLKLVKQIGPTPPPPLTFQTSGQQLQLYWPGVFTNYQL